MNRVRNLVLLIFCFGCCFHASAQNTNSGQPKETNLYEYGEPLTSPEMNLKNLFRNFPLYIDNAEMLQLIGYEYAGAVKNRRQARRYARSNFKMPLFGTTRSMYDGEEYIYQIAREKGGLSKVSSSITLAPEEITVKRREVRSYADEFIKPGYLLYAIKYAYGLGVYRYYVFINPDNNKAVTYADIFGFDIPKIHFRIHDSRRASKE